MDMSPARCDAGRMRVPCLLLVTALTACVGGLDDGGSPGSDGGQAAGEDASVAGIVNAHNTARAAVQPAPVIPLPALSWSAAAFDKARAWAAGCQWGHNPSLGGFGENIFATSGTTTAQAVVDTWVSEKSNYDYSTDQCRSGGVCGHYTQVVWRATTGVGCAAQTCTSGSPFSGGAWQFWVCDYTPAGNSGGRPY